MHEFWVGCIGKYCHHSSELCGNTDLLRRFAPEISQYCPTIPQNDDSIYRYILPRTNAFPQYATFSSNKILLVLVEY